MVSDFISKLICDQIHGMSLKASGQLISPAKKKSLPLADIATGK